MRRVVLKRISRISLEHQNDGEPSDQVVLYLLYSQKLKMEKLGLHMWHNFILYIRQCMRLIYLFFRHNSFSPSKFQKIFCTNLPFDPSFSCFFFNLIRLVVNDIIKLAVEIYLYLIHLSGLVHWYGFCALKASNICFQLCTYGGFLSNTTNPYFNLILFYLSLKERAFLFQKLVDQMNL